MAAYPTAGLFICCRHGKVVAAVAVSGLGEACRNQAGVTTAEGEVSQHHLLSSLTGIALSVLNDAAIARITS
jgi:hypothetical protein